MAGFADIISAAAGIARTLTVPQGLTVQCKLTVGAAHAYDPVADTTTDQGGEVLELPGLRYSQGLQMTQGLNVHHHKTDGLVAFNEMILFYASDLDGYEPQQDDKFLIQKPDATWEQWQIKAITSPPTNPIFTASIERS
jgi:hypothetical protein